MPPGSVKRMRMGNRLGKRKFERQVKDMGKEEIKDGRIFLNNGYGTTYNFEIVEKIPAGFGIWNIPEIGNGEYIPVYESLRPEDKDCYDVNTKTLKAVRLDKEEVAILRRAASCGADNVKSAKMALKRVAKSSMMKRKQVIAEKALPILEKITL